MITLLTVLSLCFVSVTFDSAAMTCDAELDAHISRAIELAPLKPIGPAGPGISVAHGVSGIVARPETIKVIAPEIKASAPAALCTKHPDLEYSLEQKEHDIKKLFRDLGEALKTVSGYEFNVAVIELLYKKVIVPFIRECPTVQDQHDVLFRVLETCGMFEPEEVRIKIVAGFALAKYLDTCQRAKQAQRSSIQMLYKQAIIQLEALKKKWLEARWQKSITIRYKDIECAREAVVDLKNKLDACDNELTNLEKNSSEKWGKLYERHLVDFVLEVRYKDFSMARGVESKAPGHQPAKPVPPGGQGYVPCLSRYNPL